MTLEMRPQLALPSGTDQRLIVDSSNIWDYLAQDPSLTYPNQPEFAADLDFSLISHYLWELHEYKAIGSTLSKERAEELEKLCADGKLSQFERVAFRVGLQDRGNLEKYRSIYVDWSMDQIKASEIIVGEHESVGDDITELCVQGLQPLIPVHTHPYNILPSRPDYADMFYPLNLARRQRLVMAGIVICPDIQILTIANSATPLIEPESYNELLRQSPQDYLSEVEYQRLIGMKNIRAFLSNRLVTLMRDSEEAVVNGVPERIDEIVMLEVIRRNSHLKLYNSAIAQLRREYEDYNAMTTNGVLLNFARLNDILLYASTDFTHFKKFSA